MQPCVGPSAVWGSGGKEGEDVEGYCGGGRVQYVGVWKEDWMLSEAGSVGWRLVWGRVRRCVERRLDVE